MATDKINIAHPETPSPDNETKANIPFVFLTERLCFFIIFDAVKTGEEPRGRDVF